MSFRAVSWALAQPIDKSSVKFVLVAMGHCHNSAIPEMLCWPAVKTLADLTSQDRKTVMQAQQRLRDLGYLEDTGDRKGVTGQVVVYRLKTPKNGIISPPMIEDEVAGEVAGMLPNGPKSGAVSDGTNSAGNGTGSESGTVPFFPPNSTVFPVEQYQISLETVPKTGHGIGKEYGTEEEKEKGSGKRARKDAADPANLSQDVVQLLHGTDAQHLTDWLRVRKDKKAGALTVSAIKRLATEAQKVGLSVPQAIEFCAGMEWRGFYADGFRRQQQGGQPGLANRPGHPAKPNSRHSGFAERDYGELGDLTTP